MAIHNEKRKLCYTPQQLFELVAQVERYPEFLPLWHYVNVSKNEQIDTEHRVYVTDQVIQLGLIYKRFRTTTTLEDSRHIHIVSSDPMFQKFSINWSFSACDKHQTNASPETKPCCQVDFTLNCEASSILLRPVFDVVLMDTARSIVTAFENRAGSIYDH